jgi:hypothetical protein
MDLDTSWIEKEEKINSIQQHSVRELPDKINLYYIYIDTNNSIEKVEKESEVLVDSKISKERILQIIQTKRKAGGGSGSSGSGSGSGSSNGSSGATKYKLFDILSFQVHLDPEKLFFFSKNENMDELTEYSQSFFRSIPLFDEITVVPSIFIFHETNGIYFLFKACSSPSLRSILKGSCISGSGSSSSMDSKNRVTKKVRISLDTDDVHEVVSAKTMKTRPEIAKHTRKNKPGLQ